MSSSTRIRKRGPGSRKFLVFALLFVAAADAQVPPPTQGFSVVNNVRAAEAASDNTSPSPFFAVRSAGSISGPGEGLVIPAAAPNVYPEAELAIIVGRRASRVGTDEAGAYIQGYTCGMDGTAIFRSPNGEMMWGPSIAGKSLDGIAPVGGGFAPALDPQGHDVILRVNGVEQLRFNTRQLVWGPERIVSEISQTVTLQPGDVIYTGTLRPGPQLTPGDRVEVQITGICTLGNPVVGETGPQKPVD